MLMHALEWNYIALGYAILTDDPVDKILFKLGLINEKELKKLDTFKMKELRAKGLTYKQIGEMYNLKPDAVYNRIRRLE